MRTRNQLADELMMGCPNEIETDDEMWADHKIIADAIRDGAPLETILDMPETNKWPDTYAWLRLNFD